jgi:hypothetical protein
MGIIVGLCKSRPRLRDDDNAYRRGEKSFVRRRGHF